MADACQIVGHPGSGRAAVNVLTIGRRGRSPRPVLLATARWLGVVLTAAMGLIHVWLWFQGYREIPVIGALFMINAVCSAALVAALLAAPARLRRATAALAAFFTAGTLAGLIVSLTIGLFGVHESFHAPLVPTTLIVESAGALVLGLTALLAG
ncbi:MAG TPA: hypothetical protein VFO16_15045 [Pseudonocardiaceae bacterium]|nr:hypothetical protein [Pseudonocardiaceae bacterium]